MTRDRDEENIAIVEALVEASRFDEAVALWENEYGPEMAGQLVSVLLDEGYLDEADLAEIAAPALEADEEADAVEVTADDVIVALADVAEEEAREDAYERALEAVEVAAGDVPFYDELAAPFLVAADGDPEAAGAAYAEFMRAQGGDEAARAALQEAFMRANDGDPDAAGAAFNQFAEDAGEARRDYQIAATKASFLDQPRAGSLDDAIADLHAEVLVDAAERKAQARPQGGRLADAVDEAL